MIEFSDTRPSVSVAPAEYHRLLGYPRDRLLDGRAAELEGQARTWYERHGRPWVYARQARAVDIDASSITIDGATFTPGRLRALLRQADAHAAVMVAVCAGPEIEAEASRHWNEDRPDEYFFFDVYGSSVVEHLMTSASARLCAWAAGNGCAVLPHDSPGYPGWPVGEQPRLLALLERAGAPAWPGPLEALDSGALRPTKSQLAVFGLTRHAGRLHLQAGTVPCGTCPFEPCDYRRAPYNRRCHTPT